MDLITYSLLSKKIKDTLVGMGALKGAPCEVKSVERDGGVTTITLKWTDTTGTEHTTAFDINDGVSVTNATINNNSHLILTLSDGDSIDCGGIPVDTYTKNEIGDLLELPLEGDIVENIVDVYNIATQGAAKPVQVDEVPTADAEQFKRIIQYTGDTTDSYINGCFYKCEYVNNTYVWNPITVIADDAFETSDIDFSSFSV